MAYTDMSRYKEGKCEKFVLLNWDWDCIKVKAKCQETGADLWNFWKNEFLENIAENFKTPKLSSAGVKVKSRAASKDIVIGHF